MTNHYTLPNFTGDDYEEPELAPLTPEQIAARNKAWPEYADYEHLGNLSAVDPPYQVTLQCHDCRVTWIGCQDAAECPRCDTERLTERLSDYQEAAKQES